MTKLPWNEAVPTFSIHGESADPRDVERLASEYMEQRKRMCTAASWLRHIADCQQDHEAAQSRAIADRLEEMCLELVCSNCGLPTECAMCTSCVTQWPGEPGVGPNPPRPSLKFGREEAELLKSLHDEVPDDSDEEVYPPYGEARLGDAGVISAQDMLRHISDAESRARREEREACAALVRPPDHYGDLCSCLRCSLVHEILARGEA